MYSLLLQLYSLQLCLEVPQLLSDPAQNPQSPSRSRRGHREVGSVCKDTDYDYPMHKISQIATRTSCCRRARDARTSRATLRAPSCTGPSGVEQNSVLPQETAKRSTGRESNPERVQCAVRTVASTHFTIKPPIASCLCIPPVAFIYSCISDTQRDHLGNRPLCAKPHLCRTRTSPAHATSCQPSVFFDCIELPD